MGAEFSEEIEKENIEEAFREGNFIRDQLRSKQTLEIQRPVAYPV
jgi:hypothetical protein